MYEAVHARPDGESTVARQALTAGEYGYDGIVVRNHGDSQAAYDRDRIAEEYGVDVATGIEIRADDPSRASGFLGNYRPDRTIVAVHGGSTAMNRFAVEQAAVDVLAHPMCGSGDFNHVLAKAAADNGVRVEFSLGAIVQQSGGSRVRAIQGLRKLRDLVVDAGTPYVVSVDPATHLELRAPRDLAALGERIGFEAEEVRTGLAEWGHLVERNRERRSEGFVEPGVSIDEE
ncbi:RNase P subunit p30 family protein [Halomicroarcula sp. GCM10025709]|uniref:RNase P subunit p30 family protein n=1 Tax=Haloarcula TaxID=2237 RepID=UPI0024C36E38|nr:RNase P subunit p30 family protein [Halomicroarcula sp. YJ-61-S]